MRNTKQQELIYNIVARSSSHPSAEMIFEEARLTMPKISLGTVYRILKNLSERGKILRIPMENGDRFDKTICTHAHFVCDVCGKVTDIPFELSDQIISQISAESENRITHCNAILKGICKACANKK